LKLFPPAKRIFSAISVVLSVRLFHTISTG
jgi:hypothetical protein